MNDKMLAVLRLAKHINVGDNVMVSPISERFRNAGKVAKKVFQKVYGTILEYPADGENAGKVLAVFVLHEHKEDRQEIAWWFDVEDLFVRPVVPLVGSSIFN